MTENEKQRQLDINSIMYADIIDGVKANVEDTLSDILNNIEYIKDIDEMEDVLFEIDKLRNRMINLIEDAYLIKEDEESIEKGIKVYYDDYEEEYMLEKRG